MRCTATHLVDCSYLMDSHKYLSACSLSMTAKICFNQSPLINIISKIDLLGKLGRPQMNLIDLENLSGLHYLFWGLGEDSDEEEMPPQHRTPWQAFNKKYGKLTTGLCELIENWVGMSGYLLLDLTSREMLCYIIMQIDKSNGYFEQPEKVKNEKEMAIDYETVDRFVQTEAVMQIYEKYVEAFEEERKAPEARADHTFRGDSSAQSKIEVKEHQV